ncbi:MAG: calcium/sodium antiporter [Phycisphaeraceae bacterium]|nr:calcium/sodium antiporter [Phycisphaeraceae bacterium]
MDLGIALLALVGGIILLSKCADVLVSGAVHLANHFSIPPLVIGLTIVAMGTSAPEVAASIAAVFQGPDGGDIAMGNVFGSNIANLALVGGVVVLIRPLIIPARTLRFDMTVMLAVGLILWPILSDLRVTRPEALFLLTLFVLVTGWTIFSAKRNRPLDLTAPNIVTPESIADLQKPLSRSVVLIGIGLVGLAAGAQLAVWGAIRIGAFIGLSKAVIGLSIVAFGTSLPELVTCVVAALRGHDDISVGNLVGSNIFNTLLVTGVAGVSRPFQVSPRFAGGTDYWAMITIGFIFLALGLLGKGTVGKKSGLLLLSGYIGYMAYTILKNA